MTPLAPAILTTFFSGEEGGTALARVLFGDVNPAGRLPMAMLQNPTAAPVPYWRSLQPSTYYDGSTAAVFPLGHGLSYTDFSYSAVTAQTSTAPTDGTIRLRFTVENAGRLAGEEVVQVYGRDLIARRARRTRILVAFQRVMLEAGEAARFEVDVPASMFALWDDRDGWIIEPGDLRFYIGGSSAKTPLQTRVTLTGDVANLGAATRGLRSTIRVISADEADTDSHDTDVNLSAVPQVDETSTIREWLDHPVGGPLLRARLGDIPEDMLTPAFGLSLEQMAFYSQGQIPDELVQELVEGVRRASVDPAVRS